MLSDPTTPPDDRCTVHIDGPVDLSGTLGLLQHGVRDRMQQRGTRWVRRAVRVDGVARTVELVGGSFDTFDVRVWGPPCDAESLAERLLGAHDDPRRFRPEEGPLRDLARRSGVRFPRDTSLLPTLGAAIFGQRVTSVEAQWGWSRLLDDHGERAPGPYGLICAPPAEEVASMPYHAFHRYGLDRRRADTLRRACREIARVGDDERAIERVRRVRGIGPWTTSLIERAVRGDPDTPIVGDFHLPNTVVWVLHGRSRGTDSEMLELLEPFAGQRGRAQRLIALSADAPKFGARHRIEWIAGK